ncbi:DUF2948 domain-containing protein [Alsobacter soli]|uniref:DUF2948 domain-containing protein n=1 Tax=Alsobacter soli TaxID=2109933 RepID=A0A2T1HYI6_9HYPH|nr:DUF2948 family protein [Alsobacter soli]PSC06757.1 DUF2948 domain-containing protein [Alsobacter soli]
MTGVNALKLVALDDEDLAVVSAHLQDAVLKVADITWLPREKRFAFVANRFAWEAQRTDSGERRRTGVCFTRVLKVQHSRIRCDEPEAVLNLLAVTFTAGESPSGVVTLVFSGGGAIRLEVECLEAEMRDLGPAWETPNRPVHQLQD